MDKDEGDKQVMNGSEEREVLNLTDIVEENESGESDTTDLLPILTLGIEDVEEEREKNDTNDNLIPSTGSGSVSFEAGSGQEPEMQEGQRGSDADLSQEFLFDESADDSMFNSSLEEDEEADPGYLLPLFQIEEESGTLIGKTTTEQEVLFETEQTKGDAAEEKLLPSSTKTLSATEEGRNDGAIKDEEDPVGGKPDSPEVGVEVGIVVAVSENYSLALQDSEEGHQVHQFASDEKDHNEEDGRNNLASLEKLDSDKILDGLNSQDNLGRSVYLDIQNIDRQGERHSGKSEGTSYLLPGIKIKYIGENSSLEDSYDDSHVSEEDYILSEESFGDGSLQNAHGYELAIDQVDYNYERMEDYDSNGGKRNQLSEEKDEELFATESLMPEIKSFPPSETHLSSGWEEVGTETQPTNDEESEDQDEGGYQETSSLSEEEVHPEDAVLEEGDSLPEENPQNYRRPCIPFLGNHGEPRLVTTPLLFIFALTGLALHNLGVITR